MEETLKAQLHTINVPRIEKSLGELGWVKNIQKHVNHIVVDIHMDMPFLALKQPLTEQVLKQLKAITSDTIEVRIKQSIQSRIQASHKGSIPQVKNVIAVASCKGGVGKSTTAVNLAWTLSHMGANVGLLDADIYGPSIPKCLGVTQKPEIIDEKYFKPIERYGLKTISIGYLIDEKTPMVWRGPMVTKALQQLCFDTAWGELDYLILDLPPGTGDIQLTLAQKVPLTGTIMVTTPQDLAVSEVQKGIVMFEKVQVPILGLIENMSVYNCPHCHQESYLFGQNGAEKVCATYHVPLLGKIPLYPDIVQAQEKGLMPLDDPKLQFLYNTYQDIVFVLLKQMLTNLRVNYNWKLPKVILEK